MIIAHCTYQGAGLHDSCWANGNHEAAKFWQEVNEIALASLMPELYNIVIIDSL